MTPYYSDELVTIYHGDCREIIGSLPEPSLVIADPPYGQTSLPWDIWPGGWPASMPGRSLWCFGTLRMFMGHVAEFEHAGWHLSQDVIWEKHNGSSLAADRFSRVHEQVAHFYRGRWLDTFHEPQFTMDSVGTSVGRSTQIKHLGYQSDTRPPYRREPGGPRLMRSVIRVHSTHGYAENETQKPTGIITPLVSYACPTNGLVLDPFAGAGSTLVACKLLGVRSIGIEIREEQCEIAARRCSQGVLGLETA